MKSVTIVRTLLAASIAVSASCADAVQAPRAVEVVADGRAYANLLQRQARLGVDEGARMDLERAYLERLRLGLGSPFRLMDQAMADVRLPPQRRRMIAAALLARTLDGDAYHIDPVILDIVGPPYQAERVGSGSAHLRLITEAVREATDPRAGEQAVRLAYLLAQADGSIDAHGTRLSVQVAGQVLDRELARRDAIRLLAQARRERADPLDLVQRWRAERRFEVERPRMGAADRDAEKYAMRLGPRLAHAIGDLSSGRAVLAAETRLQSRPILGSAAARRLLIALDSAAPPPQAPVAVTVSAIMKGMPDAPGADDPASPVLASLTDEERFALGAALITAERPDLRAFVGRTGVWVGTALRPYAQERVWPASETPPASRELAREFGLAAIDFDPAVPAEWRPHYRRLLHESLIDMQRVLPALDLRRLSIRIGAMDERTALALHDPRTRTIHLPPRTGAGTVAHEIAHDMDWQVALKRYRVRGDYGSDQSARRPADRLAATFQGLTGAVLDSASPVQIDRTQHQTRPAEVFARSIDWFVAASLAREGRSNGYLSSVQDDLLTGYGTVTAPDITGRAGAALVSILDEVAPLHAETRAWFLAEFGPGRLLTPTDLVRQVTHAVAPPSGDVLQPGRALESALVQVQNAAAQAMQIGVCSPAATLDPELADLRRGLVNAAAAASARGLAKRTAAQAFGPRGARWVSAHMEPGPWPEPADSMTVAEVRRLTEQVRVFSLLQEVEQRSSFQMLTPDVGCRTQTVFGDIAVARM